MLALACVSCASEQAPHKPAIIHDAKNAVIVPLEEQMGLYPNIWTVVTKLDGVSLTRTDKEAKEPLLVAPGKHQIHLLRKAGKYNEAGVFNIDVHAGQIIQIRSGWPKGDFSPIVIWLEDAVSGTPITRDGVITENCIGCAPYQIQLGAINLDDLAQKR